MLAALHSANREVCARLRLLKTLAKDEQIYNRTKRSQRAMTSGA
jgi:hypothetical protein